MNTDIIKIPLNKIFNANKISRIDDLVFKDRQEFIETVKVAGSLIHHLSVTKSPEGDNYDVIAGRKKYDNLKILAKVNFIAKDHPVDCLVYTNKQASFISMLESLFNKPMHHIDEYIAYTILINDGYSIREISKTFGITMTHIEQRLSLGISSPRKV